MTSTFATETINFSPIDSIAGYFSNSADKIDRSEIGLYEGLKYLFCSHAVMTEKLSNIGNTTKSQSLIKEVSDAIASVAYEDMASAFAAWCHRMVIEYVYQSETSNSHLKQLLSDLKQCSIFGSTAMGPGTANFLTGTEIPIRVERENDEFTANGIIRWASNLTGKFVIVTAVKEMSSDNTYIVTIPGNSQELHINDFTKLLGLDQTFSTSMSVTDLKIPNENIVTQDFSNFMRSIIVPFLILQSSFCKGLAARSLHESLNMISGPKTVFEDELQKNIIEFNQLSDELEIETSTNLASDDEIRRLLKARLNFALLASSSVNLEYKLCGGAAYSISSPVSRRLREAAFLPIQAPTEVQLRWILSQ
tara:strand:+ start:642 stop:1733 length:1092 start_codon:yes stop_codon:yes gene_type:complete